MKVALRLSPLVAAVALACSLTAVSASATNTTPAAPAAAALVSLLENRMLANLTQLQSDIKLNAAQKDQFDQCIQKMLTLRSVALGAADGLQRTINAELEKPQPDLDLVASTSDSLQAQMISARRSVRSEWLRLYSMLSPEQKSVVGAHLHKQWDRFGTALAALSTFAAVKP